jgi:H/ACA ribonucleoprotein complex subunit 2
MRAMYKGADSWLIAAAQRTLKRGVKEVVKSLRKSPSNAPSSSVSADSTTLPLGIVILAADISPMDVIAHIPVLCEDHNIPYIFVTSRAELGMAGQTKRPTSVVMVGREGGKGKKVEEQGEGDGEDWAETYRSLVKVVLREMPLVKK